MKEFTIGKNDAGQRLDRFLGKAVPLLPASLAQKYIRIKRIKLNGGRAERDTRLNTGDVLQLYINDDAYMEDYLKDGYTPAFEIPPEGETYTVPENSYFCMGDNRVGSVDSRRSSVGCVSRDLIKGKVVIRLFPFNKIQTF
jgi:signal peptidase I